MRLRLIAFALVWAVVTVNHAHAVVYDAAAAFEAGWLANSNPNGVWSYGYSATPGGSLTLYTAQVPGNDSPNQQMWIAPTVNCCVASPSVGFNNGPAFDDGNVAQAANQLDLVASVNQNLATELVFTAPTAGTYTLSSTFFGDQRGIDVGVDVLKNSTSLFAGSVTFFGQAVPFDTVLSLSAGDQVTFAVTQGDGSQNTGLDATLTAAVPELSTWAMMIIGFLGLGWLVHRRHRGGTVRFA